MPRYVFGFVLALLVLVTLILIGRALQQTAHAPVPAAVVPGPAPRQVEPAALPAPAPLPAAPPLAPSNRTPDLGVLIRSAALHWRVRASVSSARVTNTGTAPLAGLTITLNDGTPGLWYPLRPQGTGSEFRDFQQSLSDQGYTREVTLQPGEARSILFQTRVLSLPVDLTAQDASGSPFALEQVDDITPRPQAPPANVPNPPLEGGPYKLGG